MVEIAAHRLRTIFLLTRLKIVVRVNRPIKLHAVTYFDDPHLGVKNAALNSGPHLSLSSVDCPRSGQKVVSGSQMLMSPSARFVLASTARTTSASQLLYNPPILGT